MSDVYIWLAYLATYGLILGYAATMWSRLRSRGERSVERRP